MSGDRDCRPKPYLKNFSVAESVAVAHNAISRAGFRSRTDRRISTDQHQRRTCPIGVDDRQAMANALLRDPALETFAALRKRNCPVSAAAEIGPVEPRIDHLTEFSAAGFWLDNENRLLHHTGGGNSMQPAEVWIANTLAEISLH